MLEKEVGTCESQNGEELVLICGPETLEKSVHGFLNDMGWKDEDLLFF
jgi:nitrate reductase (NAD(P)H)